MIAQNKGFMRMKDIKAIQTKYKGYNFRSRLEARWAVFFDAIKTNWQYEPEGFDLGEAGLYLPDFYLEDIDCWAEVKAKPLNQAERSKAFALSSFTNKPVIELLSIPEPQGNKCLFASMLIGANFSDYDDFFFPRNLVDWYCEQNNKERGEGTFSNALAWDVQYYQKKYGKPHPTHFTDGMKINHLQFFTGNERIEKALTKARSSRFEFGETPWS